MFLIPIARAYHGPFTNLLGLSLSHQAQLRCGQHLKVCDLRAVDDQALYVTLMYPSQMVSPLQLLLSNSDYTL